MFTQLLRKKINIYCINCHLWPLQIQHFPLFLCLRTERSGTRACLLICLPVCLYGCTRSPTCNRKGRAWADAHTHVRNRDWKNRVMKKKIQKKRQ